MGDVSEDVQEVFLQVYCRFSLIMGTDRVVVVVVHEFPRFHL